MQDINVVITFYSRTGTTEKLALGAALGAVNARGNIRLRRLPEIADAVTISRVPAWKETSERMNGEYVAPREADALWADVLIMGTPPRICLSSPEMQAYVDWLTPLGSEGRLKGKLGLAFTSGPMDEENQPELDSANAFMVNVGLIAVPFEHANGQGSITIEGAQGRGRYITEIARALKPISHLNT